MDGLSSIIVYIGRTNLFNFVIFLSIFILIFKAVHLGDMLENAVNSVKEHIEESKNKKAESESHLKDIEGLLSHVEEEVDGIIKKSDENARLVGEKILNDAKNTVNGIKDNSKKMVENRSALLKNDILKRASIASIEVAKQHIIAELNNNYDLHQKLIDESLSAIDGYKG